MPSGHSKATIVSMAVVADGLGSILHEGLGHGLTAWLRGDIVTELTSNHLSDVRPDHWVDAAGTTVNLIAGVVLLIASRAAGDRANTRFFLWFLASINLLSGAGYFLFSGILGLGDWAQFIQGLPHQAAIRTGMALFGAVLYVLFVRLVAVNIRPFVASRPQYNSVGRLPYYAACIFSCIAGAFDPLGIQLLFYSTIPAAFGGISGLMWADSLMPRALPTRTLIVRRSPTWWVVAVIFGLFFVATMGRGIPFKH